MDSIRSSGNPVSGKASYPKAPIQEAPKAPEGEGNLSKSNSYKCQEDYITRGTDLGTAAGGIVGGVVGAVAGGISSGPGGAVAFGPLGIGFGMPVGMMVGRLGGIAAGSLFCPSGD